LGISLWGKSIYGLIHFSAFCFGFFMKTFLSAILLIINFGINCAIIKPFQMVSIFSVLYTGNQWVSTDSPVETASQSPTLSYGINNVPLYSNYGGTKSLAYCLHNQTYQSIMGATPSFKLFLDNELSTFPLLSCNSFAAYLHHVFTWINFLLCHSHVHSIALNWALNDHFTIQPSQPTFSQLPSCGAWKNFNFNFISQKRDLDFPSPWGRMLSLLLRRYTSKCRFSVFAGRPFLYPFIFLQKMLFFNLVPQQWKWACHFDRAPFISDLYLPISKIIFLVSKFSLYLSLEKLNPLHLNYFVSLWLSTKSAITQSTGLYLVPQQWACHLDRAPFKFDLYLSISEILFLAAKFLSVILALHAILKWSCSFICDDEMSLAHGSDVDGDNDDGVSVDGDSLGGVPPGDAI
jgi:hypothetical protein